jgi:formate/nitrite transporter FocA (FNT family)
MTPGEQPLPAVTASPQDAYPPMQIARLVGEVGVRKATMPAIQTTMLGVLAGAFIAFGVLFLHHKHTKTSFVVLFYINSYSL